MNKYPGGVDDDSIETQLKNTTKQVSGTFQSLLEVPSEQRTAEHTTETSQPGVPVEEKEGEMNNPSAIDDDSLATQLNNTRAQVAGTFQKLFDPNSVQAAVGNIGAILNPSREKGGKMKNLPPNEDDSFATQIKHTETQVFETFKGLSTSLQQAGEMIQDTFSPKKE